jgi:hypothetical protein
MIHLGWPAPVNYRGRRRDGGVSVTLATTPRDGDDEIRQSQISLRRSAGRLNPSTISPTPSDIVLKLFLAPWNFPWRFFYWTVGALPNAP